MRLGLNVGYWGLGLTSDDQLQLVQGGRGALASTRSGPPRPTARTPPRSLGWLAGPDRAHQDRLGDLPDAGPLAGDDGDDRGHARPALGRPHDARDRLLRPPGGRGLARPALRPPARAHARVRGDRAQGARPRAARLRGRDVHAAAARRPGQGAEAHDRAGAGAHPDLPRGDRPEEHAARRRDRRRLAADRSSRPRTWASRASCSRRAPRAPAARWTASTSRPSVQVAIDDDVERARDVDAARSSRSTSAGWARASRTSTTRWSGATGSRRRRSEVQDLYLEGKKDEAAAALPDELIDTVTLAGPREHMRERLASTTRPASAR